ncbi:MAG TPA: hypothetical protein VF041_05520 [Gemmatimonadaceae bacterium]
MRAPILDARAAVAIVLAGAMAVGCRGDDLATQPSSDPSALYWRLELDHHAVTLATAAPYDTIRLTATPRNPSGAAIDGLGPVTYTSTDLAHARVSADGVVQALAEGANIAIIATLQGGNATHSDTTWLTVTADSAPRPLDSLSIHPVPPDSAKVAMGYAGDVRPLTVYAFDADHDPMAGLLVDFRSSDPTTATIDRQTGIIVGQRPGRVSIVATATAYGVTRADTLPFTIGLPIIYFASVTRAADAGAATTTTFTPSDITVGTGATILWSWQQDIPATDVTFDDATNVAASDGFGPLHYGASGPGDIPAPTNCVSTANPFMQLFACRNARTFPVPGVYPYRSTLTGATGRITVVDEHAATQRRTRASSPHD